MSPKRRIISDTSEDEEDSFKHRRTSLRVNLSFANLTDSGNGSLWKTETENEEVSHRSQAGKELSRSKSKSTNENRSHFESDKRDDCVASEQHATNNKDSAKEEVKLKDLRIYLKDINTKERVLETKCRRLKDAILNKTKEAFDEDHELSIKITKVLRNEDANDVHANAEDESVLVLDKTSDHLSNIFETPSNHHQNTTRKRHNSVDKSRLPQRQLFDREDKQEETKCRVIENVILKNRPINILQQSEQSGSPILSGSNKRLSLLRKRSKDRSGKLNSTYSTVHSVQSVDIGAPIICSTFIEDNATSDDEEARQTATDRANSDVDASPAARTINTVMSMEMTKIHGSNRASEKYESSQIRDPSTNKCIEEVRKTKGDDSMRNKSMQRLKDASRSRSTVQSNAESSDSHCTDEDEASVYVDTTVVPGRKSIEVVAVMKKAREAHKSGDKTENEKQRTLSLSKGNETIRSSLNVNTSLGALDESVDKDKNVEKSRKMMLDDQRESTSTVRTSLRVNTSTDFVRGPSGGTYGKSSLPRDGYDPVEANDSNNRRSKLAEENAGADNVDYLENISLYERLRNVSERKQLSRENASVSGKRDAKEEAAEEAKNTGSGKSQNNMRASGDSCVEATPYPVSRSFLFKTLLKHKPQNPEDSASPCNNGTNPSENEKESDIMKSSASIPKSSNEAPVSAGTLKTVGADTVVLENTLSGNPFVTQAQSSNDKHFAIRDRSPSYDPCVTQDKSVLGNITGKANLETEEEKERTADSQNTECVPAKVGKRKLLPLSDGSELCSITPIDENECPVAKKSPVKRIKKLTKRKKLNFKKDTSIDKHKKTSEPTSSDSDDEILRNFTKKQDKKTRKPRKVISKKIVIKKFADNNVLNILEREKLTQQNKRDLSRGSRDSLDEFVNFRTIPIQRNNHKSHKIVIATTGLSKGDKSLVKSIVKSLGNADMELNVTKRTTHVVSSGVRTVNLLRGIIRGCWLVTLEWVLKSLENNRWLNPEEFEMKHFSKAVQENRKDRQLFGPSYIPELFTTCGFIYVEHKTTVPCATLKELIKTAGGHITENAKTAKIIIGPNGLKETWIIDSITTGELQLTQLYKRQ